MSTSNLGQTEFYNYMKKKYTNNKQGFTLVELLVSLAIFSIVVIAALGAMLSISDANRRVQKTRAVLDNLSLSIESMTRNLRLGNTYHCEKIISNTIPTSNLNIASTASCDANGGWGDFIAYEDQYGDPSNATDQGIYYLDSDPSSPTNGSIMYKKYDGTNAIALTSPDLKVGSLRFYVSGLSAGQQPKIIITLSGTSTVGKAQEPVEINIQTTVSQRPLNI
jgi:prepilin-type N-terminal cleavage/methylation domain-containing protein